ncbi:stalk domain-containing protein [Paenibacillus flagellatus]|uniref:Copper amine oxidase n=1 Tax=Paenibacillus flagellatus TaxID=2211139 RepID=A0A2V5KIN6_9BACL|nr:stalk domain-containing protein [Paenibacillus flagellatus]PYI54360.1 hypothetical protein DLM86_12865 [Paenibacillus flagellatus]
MTNDLKATYPTKTRRFPPALIAVSAAAVLAVTLAAPSGFANASADSVRYETRSVAAAGKTFPVKLVTVDLTDPHLSVEPVVAGGGIGTDQIFGAMMAASGAVAGINGTFFDAYEDDPLRRFPNGAMMRSGDVVHSGDGPTFAIGADKTGWLARWKTQTEIRIGSGASAYPVRPWGVNAYYGESSADQVVLFTPDFGRPVDYPGGMKIVVSEGAVRSVTDTAADVPEDGYVLFVGLSDNNRTYLLPNVAVGARAALRTTLVAPDGSTAADASRVLAAVGAGPKLVGGGAVDVDFARDGFDDPKLTTASGARSFIGIDGSGRLAMGTTPSATIAELAQVAVSLGLVEAMNLDGGASSALYADGAVVTRPGRPLSNAFVVKRHDNPQVQVVVNGSFVHEFRGYVENETTMAPFRGIFERLGAPFRWNGDERTVTAELNGRTVLLRPDVATATVDGEPVALSAAPRIVDGHLYIPLRFVAETFGAKVTWNQALYRASIDL